MSTSRSTILGFFIISLIAVLFWFPCSSTAAQRVIGQVKARANYDNWGGACPKEFKFNGTIQILAAPSEVNYRWERSDGAIGPQTVVNVKQGQKIINVNDSWTLGTSGEKIKIYEILVVESGNQRIKARTKTMPIHCK